MAKKGMCVEEKEGKFGRAGSSWVRNGVASFLSRPQGIARGRRRSRRHGVGREGLFHVLAIFMQTVSSWYYSNVKRWEAGLFSYFPDEDAASSTTSPSCLAHILQTQRVQPRQPRPPRSANPCLTMKKTATFSLMTMKLPSQSDHPRLRLQRWTPLTTAMLGRARGRPRPAVAAARRSRASAG